MNIAYCNGIFIPSEKACIPINDKGFLFGKGIFTTILVEDGLIYFLKEHLERLQSHLQKLRISKVVKWSEILFQLIEKNKAQKGAWRLKIIVTETTDLAIIQKEPPSSKTLKLMIYKPFVHSMHAKLKTLAYLERIELLELSKQKGYDDCITFDKDQNILETAIANIFWIRNNIFYCPDPKLPYLNGITLSFAIKLAKKMQLKVVYGKFKLAQMANAIVFYCNSIKKVTAVAEIEGLTIQRDTPLQIEFIRLFHQMIKDYHSSCFESQTQLFE